jgi:hypothetical protein
MEGWWSIVVRVREGVSLKRKWRVSVVRRRLGGRENLSVRSEDNRSSLPILKGRNVRVHVHVHVSVNVNVHAMEDVDVGVEDDVNQQETRL